MFVVLLRRWNQSARKRCIVFAGTNDIFLGWNFSLETVDQFFSVAGDRIIPYTEPRSHSPLDAMAEAYIEANGATLGDSSPANILLYLFFSCSYYYLSDQLIIYTQISDHLPRNHVFFLFLFFTRKCIIHFETWFRSRIKYSYGNLRNVKLGKIYRNSLVILFNQQVKLARWYHVLNFVRS